MPRGRPRNGRRRKRGTRYRTSPGELRSARKYAKNPRANYRRTKSHAKAGLHRLGRSGNTYASRSGRIYHRVKSGTFRPGRPKRTSLPSRRTTRVATATPRRPKTNTGYRKPKSFVTPKRTATVARRAQRRGVWR